MNTQFKLGDKVRVIAENKTSEIGEHQKTVGSVGVVTEVFLNEEFSNKTVTNYEVRFGNFEDLYFEEHTIELVSRVKGLTFGQAIEALKEGKKITRSGWNGKGMFLYFVPAASYPPSTQVATDDFNGNNVPYRSYIAMKTAQGDVVPWVASQSDILEDDWEVIE